MGLARIAGTAFSDWGPAFQTVMMAIIMVNMLTGPPFFRAALIKVRQAVKTTALLTQLCCLKPHYMPHMLPINMRQA
jgi:hypothetical protein